MLRHEARPWSVSCVNILYLLIVVKDSLSEGYDDHLSGDMKA